MITGPTDPAGIIGEIAIWTGYSGVRKGKNKEVERGRELARVRKHVSLSIRIDNGI